MKPNRTHHLRAVPPTPEETARREAMLAIVGDIAHLEKYQGDAIVVLIGTYCRMNELLLDAFRADVPAGVEIMTRAAHRLDAISNADAIDVVERIMEIRCMKKERP